MGGGLEHFLRTRYHIFPRVTIPVTTHITILLWEFCTVSNALLLLAHYYWLLYALLYIFGEIGTYLYEVFLKKNYINIFFKKKLMVTRWKIDNYVLVLLKIYWTTFSNTSGNVLKIVTNKNGAKFP